jgi:hypothetical protein
MIRETPGFQGANGFDINRYRAILRDQGLTPAMYERLVSHHLAMMKDAALLESATWVSPMELDDELAAMTDRFTVRVADVSNRFADVAMRLSDEDYRKYYEENKASFALPDRVAVRYISIPVTNYLNAVTVSEDDLHEYYDSHVDTFSRTTSSNTTETIPFAEVRSKILDELKLEEARYCAETSVTFNIYGKLANVGSNALEIVAAQQKLAVKTSPLFGAEEPLYWAESAKDFASTAFDLDPERADSRFGIVKGDSHLFVIEQIKKSAAHTRNTKTSSTISGRAQWPKLAAKRSRAIPRSCTPICRSSSMRANRSAKPQRRKRSTFPPRSPTPSATSRTRSSRTAIPSPTAP